MNQATAPTATTARATKTATAGACDFFSGGGGTAVGGASGGTPAGGIDALGTGAAAGMAVDWFGLTSVASGTESIVASADVASGRGIDDDDSAAAARIAAANSFAVWKRSAARLASALRITASIAGSTCTFNVDGGSGSSLSTFCIVVVADPAKGRSPVRN